MSSLSSTSLFPACKPGGVLVRSLYSLISTGTEMMKVSEARLSLLGKARARPDQVRKLLDSVAQQGALATYQKAMNRLDSYTPLGYSLCGVVVEVGAGRRASSPSVSVVAAAGNEFALHAEVNWVPTNLCVPVPDGVAPEHAAFATVGAIAMQGVRRAEVAARRDRVRDRARADRPARRCGCWSRPASRSSASTWSRPLPDGGEGRRARLRRTRRRRAREVERVLLERTGGLGADHILLAAGGDSNGRSRSRPGWRGTGPASSTSARPGSTCPGTPTTTRSSTSASPGPTGRAATTTATSSRASTTRPATSAGPSAATSAASSTSWRTVRSTSRP